MRAQRLLPAAVASAAALTIAADWFVNGRGLGIMAAPAAAAGLMAVAAVLNLLVPQPGPSASSGVAPVRIPVAGRPLGTAAALAVALLSPRIGVPLLAFAIARHQRMRLAAAVAVAAAAALASEIMLAFVVVTRISVIPF